MTGSTRKNRLYAVGQTSLLILFGVLYFLTDGRRLFAGNVAQNVGQALCFAGLALILVAIASLRDVIQVSPEPRASGVLVTGGIYRWLRHPIYTGVLIAIAGLFLKKPTVIIAIACVAVAVFLWLKTRYEEFLLTGTYPDYRTYRSTSWGLFPGFKG